MLILSGSSSISEPKRQNLLHNIQKSCPKIISVDPVWIHLIHCRSSDREEELSNSTSTCKKSLDRLLAYGDDVRLDDPAEVLAKQRNIVYVLPRPGSISPWSSKATDIARLCKLGDYIERIERGTAFLFTTKDDQDITKDDISTFSQHIHDRMTQIVQISFPLEHSLFLHEKPKPLRMIDLQNSSATEGARAKLISANSELGLALSADEVNYLVDAYI